MLIFGLTGQSNMVGYQTPAVTTWPVYNNASRIFAWQNGTWVPAKDPLGPAAGGISAGVGPGMAFADHLIDLMGNIQVGLVMTAVGGTFCSQWIPFWFDSPPWYYGVALSQFRAAGTLSGIIDYQGESDASLQPTSATIESFVINKRLMIDGFRSDLGQPTLPVVVTRLGPNPGTQPAWSGIQTCVDQFALVSPPNIGAVSASDLVPDKTGIHLSANSQITLGHRYAETMAKLLGN